MHAATVPVKLGFLQVEPADEHPQPAKEGLLVSVQQIVAPGDRVPERPLPSRQNALTAGEQWKAMDEPRPERLRRQQLHPCGLELNRQRQAIQPPPEVRYEFCRSRRVRGVGQFSCPSTR
jgi:hypothetical protein